ncbi:carotenoid oxygenase family protein [Acinetobacter sp. ANC 3832]|uniref:carotenoid oxygenase family protein n=1 Tax=Acinetobacter sp. ANC 3832 TaxID=1977874 RepID=UPI001D175EAA|nr:carotenoid oxygenase family protein [Acinetobacter sp. ANC 3832]
MDMRRNNQDQLLMDYPRMTALKSKVNVFRQSLINKGISWLQRKQKKDGENIYLEGVYAPVDEVEKTDLKVFGEIPSQLNGMLLRIGPNPLQVEHPTSHHWFSGDGMLHALCIENGSASWFKSKYIQSDSIQKQNKEKLKPGFRRGPGDVVNTNAFYYADKIWAVIEAGTFPAQLDLELNTEKHQFFNTDADLPFTAHPHEDPITGHLHAICYDAFDQKHAYYEVLDQEGHLVHLCKIPVLHGPMIHDCTMTETEVLIFDFPVTFSNKQIFKGNSLPYEWNSEHQARIGVLPKYGKAHEVQWIHIDPCFVFHAANAFRDEQGKIIIDLVVYDHMFKYSQQGPFEQQKVQLERWTVNVQARAIHRHVTDEQAQEFPRIDERFTGQPYQFIYTVSFNAEGLAQANQLLIHDVQHCKKVSHDFGSEWISGEVIFIAESSSAKEGQGYLLSYVHHINALPSKVVILKVDGLDVQFQAEIDLGVRIPVGFHGNWVDLSQK